jgi:glycosyltransferase involved in cell wall biosynthesis
MHSDKKSKFSIIIPCFNEENTLKRCVKRVLEISDQHLALEIIIVDDASTDNSLSIARQLMSEHDEIQVVHHEINQGKGATVRTGFQTATGDFLAIQDADLEYNPMQLKDLLMPLINNEADVVIGSRFISSGPHRVLYFWHYMGNRFLTFLSNMLTDLNLTDMETCYKVFKREAINDITIEKTFRRIS